MSKEGSSPAWATKSLFQRSNVHMKVLQDLADLKNAPAPSPEKQKEMDEFDAKIIALRKADTNHDGDIDRNEWSTAVTKVEHHSVGEESEVPASPFPSAAYGKKLHFDSVRSTTSMMRTAQSTALPAQAQVQVQEKPQPVRPFQMATEAIHATTKHDVWGRYQSTLGQPKVQKVQESPFPAAAGKKLEFSSALTSKVTVRQTTTTATTMRPPAFVQRTSTIGKGVTRSETYKRVLAKIAAEADENPSKRARTSEDNEFDRKIIALRSADTNHDGDIDRREWQTAVTHVGDKPQVQGSTVRSSYSSVSFSTSSVDKPPARASTVRSRISSESTFTSSDTTTLMSISEELKALKAKVAKLAGQPVPADATPDADADMADADADSTPAAAAADADSTPAAAAADADAANGAATGAATGAADTKSTAGAADTKSSGAATDAAAGAKSTGAVGAKSNGAAGAADTKSSGAAAGAKSSGAAPGKAGTKSADMPPGTRALLQEGEGVQDGVIVFLIVLSDALVVANIKKGMQPNQKASLTTKLVLAIDDNTTVTHTQEKQGQGKPPKEVMTMKCGEQTVVWSDNVAGCAKWLASIESVIEAQKLHKGAANAAEVIATSSVESFKDKGHCVINITMKVLWQRFQSLPDLPAAAADVDADAAMPDAAATASSAPGDAADAAPAADAAAADADADAPRRRVCGGKKTCEKCGEEYTAGLHPKYGCSCVKANWEKQQAEKAAEEGEAKAAEEGEAKPAAADAGADTPATAGNGAAADTEAPPKMSPMMIQIAAMKEAMNNKLAGLKDRIGQSKTENETLQKEEDEQEMAKVQAKLASVKEAVAQHSDTVDAATGADADTAANTVAADDADDKTLFDRLDTNKDGVLDREEFAAAFKNKKKK